MANRLGTAVLLAAAAWTSGCGGGGGGDSTAGSPSDPPVSGPGPSTLAASRPGELLDYVKSRLAERQQLFAQQPDLAYVTSTPVPEAQPAGDASRAASSGTVVQEQGVDEDDLIKTDGELIVSLVRQSTWQAGQPSATLRLHRRLADGSVTATGKLALMQDEQAGTSTQGMLLAAPARRVAVLGQTEQVFALDVCAPGMACAAVMPMPVQRTQPRVLLDVAEIVDPSAPRLGTTMRIDGRLVGTRLIGSTLWLVTQHSPQLAVEALPASATPADRQALIDKLTARDLLPTIRVGPAGPVPLVAETDCYVQKDNASPGLEITTVTAIDLSAAALTRASRCFVGGAEAIYVSPTSLVLATTRHAYTPATTLRPAIFPSTMTTDLHKFSLEGLTATYRGSGEVTGHLGWDQERKSYRISDWNGDLRVLTFTGETGWAVPLDASTTGQPAPSPARLTVLRERASDRSLQPLATLPGEKRPQPIGKPGEQVYAVRFLGDRGYVVTFRRTDPLYVLDLSDPADPKVAGELEMPGFSDYLFPLGRGLLLGVGKDADERGVVGGVKVALFDVADAGRPALLDSRTWGGSGSMSALDFSRHGIDLFARGDVTRAALPLWVAKDFSGAGASGLQTFEVDTVKRTLTERAWIPGRSVAWTLGEQRSVQIGDHVYHLEGGELTAHAW